MCSVCPGLGPSDIETLRWHCTQLKDEAPDAWADLAHELEPAPGDMLFDPETGDLVAIGRSYGDELP